MKPKPTPKKTVRAKGLRVKPSVIIRDCTFTGSPTWETNKVVSDIAVGLAETAKGLALLAQAIQPTPSMVIEGGNDGVSK